MNFVVKRVLQKVVLYYFRMRHEVHVDTRCCAYEACVGVTDW
jgi:hypothetical protein